VTPAGGPGPDSASYAGSGAASALAPFPVEYREGADVGYRWYAAKGETPLFPFGYGLTYTHFSYSGAHFAGGATPSATVTVRNDGNRAGVALPQLYAATGGATPRLVGWSRVALAPHTSKTVTVTLDPRAIAAWRNGEWVLADGAYRLTLGIDATHAIGAATVTLSQHSTKKAS
jgi:beta-glucosidase